MDVSTNNLKLDPNLAFLKRLFNCSCLIFRNDEKDAKISKWRLILAVIMMLIGSDIVNTLNLLNISAAYYLSSLFYYVIRWRYEVKPMDCVIISFIFQAFVSMVSKKSSFNSSF
jgi:RsiW-degrading membrane proteinase PrsW (M82 family)